MIIIMMMTDDNVDVLVIINQIILNKTSLKHEYDTLPVTYNAYSLYSLLLLTPHYSPLYHLYQNESKTRKKKEYFLD